MNVGIVVYDAGLVGIAFNAANKLGNGFWLVPSQFFDLNILILMSMMSLQNKFKIGHCLKPLNIHLHQKLNHI